MCNTPHFQVHIPFFVNGNAVKDFRGQMCVDGSLLFFLRGVPWVRLMSKRDLYIDLDMSKRDLLHEQMCVDGSLLFCLRGGPWVRLMSKRDLYVDLHIDLDMSKRDLLHEQRRPMT